MSVGERARMCLSLREREKGEEGERKRQREKERERVSRQKLYPAVVVRVSSRTDRNTEKNHFVKNNNFLSIRKNNNKFF